MWRDGGKVSLHSTLLQLLKLLIFPHMQGTDGGFSGHFHMPPGFCVYFPSCRLSESVHSVLHQILPRQRVFGESSQWEHRYQEFYWSIYKLNYGNSKPVSIWILNSCSNANVSWPTPFLSAHNWSNLCKEFSSIGCCWRNCTNTLTPTIQPVPLFWWAILASQPPHAYCRSECHGSLYYSLGCFRKNGICSWTDQHFLL